jgi:hypothetical protein
MSFDVLFDEVSDVQEDWCFANVIQVREKIEINLNVVDGDDDDA